MIIQSILINKHKKDRLKDKRLRIMDKSCSKIMNTACVDPDSAVNLLNGREPVSLRST